MRRPVHKICVAVLFLAFAWGGCDDSRSDDASNDGGPGPIGAMFGRVAGEFGIPARLLLAVALNESRMNPVPQSVTYGRDNDKGLGLAQSAFGIPLKQLGLPANESSATLSVQLNAYASWLKSQMEARHLNLVGQPATSNETFDWIWQLAQIHRTGQDTRRNVQILFAYELMAKLNDGDMWQDGASGEIVTLTKEPVPLDISTLDKPIRDSLQLYLDDSDIFPAQYFELSNISMTDDRNKPNHIEVIHCPFSLSACLQMQSEAGEDGQAKINAHYVIPPTPDLVSKPIQIRQHRDSVVNTSSNGTSKVVTDAIVVMLAGSSGHYVKGNRVTNNPKWLTKWQLSKLGSVIRHICPAIKKMNDAVDINTCISTGQTGGVTFKRQGPNEGYQWGDIPDFDEDIFRAYIQTPDALAGDVTFEFPSTQKLYDAQQPVDLKLKFLAGAAWLYIEQLVNCPDSRPIWSPIQVHRIRNTDAKNIQLLLYDKGPNGDGEQFFRAMVYGSKGELMGWDIDNIILYNYNTEPSPNVSIKECVRNGT